MKKSVIWNINRICAYDCSICCVDAYFVKKRNSSIIINSNSLKKPIKIKKETQNIYNDANAFLQKEGLELSLNDKMKILKNIDIPITLDFSGGDPLLLQENLEVIKAASKSIGKENISISTTSVGLSSVEFEYLKRHVSFIEFTYDFPGRERYINRPNNYNKNNLERIGEISQSGIKTGAQISLTKENISKNVIDKIYNDLRRAQVDEIFLMKIFPTGKGSHLINNGPTRDEYLNAVNYYKELEKKYNSPEIVIQSILSYTEKENESIEEKYYISNSLNITNLGLLTLSPWAYDNNGNPLQVYVLGNLIKTKLSILFNSNSDNELFKKLEI